MKDLMTPVACVVMALVAMALLIVCASRRIAPTDWRFFVMMGSPVISYAMGFLVERFK